MSRRAAALSTGGMAGPHEAVYVTVTIPDDKKAEFLEIMKKDLEGSRKEEGCTRFDLLQDKEDPGASDHASNTGLVTVAALTS